MQFYFDKVSFILLWELSLFCIEHKSFVQISRLPLSQNTLLSRNSFTGVRLSFKFKTVVLTTINWVFYSLPQEHLFIASRNIYLLLQGTFMYCLRNIYLLSQEHFFYCLKNIYALPQEHLFIASGTFFIAPRNIYLLPQGTFMYCTRNIYSLPQGTFTY